MNQVPMQDNQLAKGLNAWSRSLERGQEKLVGHPRLVEDGHYEVESVSGSVYNVRVWAEEDQLAYECDCLGATHGQTCWHAGLIAAQPNEHLRRVLFQLDRQMTSRTTSIEPHTMVPILGLRYSDSGK